MSLKPLILAFAAAGAASAAHAGEARCWIDQGVVVVAAQVAGVAGDYILDTGQARTVLADTRAQGAGFTATRIAGDVRLAGLSLPAQPVSVEKIDVRTGLFPTPIAGVLGADLLRGHVLDVRFAPCRIGLYRPGRTPPFAASRRLRLESLAGLPAVAAAVSDGPRARAGRFVLATGSDTPVRLSDAAARAPGAPKPREVYPYGVARPRLRALSFAGALHQNLPSGLLTTGAADELGEIGAPLLAHYRLRFDFPRGRLELAPATKKAPGMPGP